MTNTENLQLTELDSVTKVVLTEAKKEDRLTNQLLITMLSAYSKNPINLMINAPSGVGKNYVIGKVSALFPKSDVVNLARMSEKAIFHRQGTLVVKNEETDQYVSIEPDLAALEDKKQEKEIEYAVEKDKETKVKIKNEIKELDSKKRDLLKNARKLIDLSNKILIFLETPDERLIVGLLPLLSHDQYEVEYEFADSTATGIRTQTNVLRGWPVVIIAQAIDKSKSQRFSEISRRFITTNPTMSKEKYAEAIKLICYKNSVPDAIYQLNVVSDKQKDEAREIIKKLKEQILYLNQTNLPGAINVVSPFDEIINGSIPNAKPDDMTRANRINNYLSFLPTVCFSNRPRVEVSNEDDALSKVIIPIATFDDLKRAISLMEYSDGVRPFILEWFYDIFQKAYDDKNDNKDSKVNSKGQTIQESRPALTTQDIQAKHKNERNEELANKNLLETYLEPLLNRGYIDKIESEIDHRRNIYYPIIETKKIRKLFDIDKSNNLLQETKKIVVNSILFPNEVFILNAFRTILDYSSTGSDFQKIKIKNHFDEEISLEQLATQYFSNPEEYFEERKEEEIPKQEEPAKEVVTPDMVTEPGESIEGSYKCNFCTKIFLTEDSHTAHIVNIHWPVDPGLPIHPTFNFIRDAHEHEPNLYVEFRGNYWEKEGGVETLD